MLEDALRDMARFILFLVIALPFAIAIIGVLTVLLIVKW